jgi:HEAT repeat protein
MSDPFAKTIEFLASSSNQHALDVLVHALDVNHEPIRERTVAAVLKRDNVVGHVEIIRRLKSLTLESRTLVEEQVTHLAPALKRCLMGADELRRNALELIRTTENFDLAPTLVEMLGDDHNELHEAVAQTLSDLVNRLYEHCNFNNDTKAGGKLLGNATQIRQTLLNSFDQACSNFEALDHSDVIVQGILALGDADNFAVKKVLVQSDTACRDRAAELLMTSKHPGVMQLILDFMSQNYPHQRAFEAIRLRKDPEFISHLLRCFPEQLTEIQQKNFGQIDSIAWIDPSAPSLEMVPPGLQGRLVSFASATGLSGEQKMGVQKWLVREGSPEGRLAAADVLSSLDKEEARGILLNSLNSKDADVQAWATGQLRTQGIPNAVSLLLDRLDSPLDAVREAACTELKSFNFEFLMNLYEHLSPQVCLRAGIVIQKTDPDYRSKLVRELSHPITRKRIQAAKAARALGLHLQVVPTILAMLEDTDTVVRRTGAEILGSIPTSESVKALHKLLDDPSPRVRETAAKAQEQLRSPGRRKTAIKSGRFDRTVSPDLPVSPGLGVKP